MPQGNSSSLQAAGRFEKIGSDKPQSVLADKPEFRVCRRTQPDVWVLPYLPHNMTAAIALARHQNLNPVSQPANWVVVKVTQELVWEDDPHVV